MIIGRAPSIIALSAVVGGAIGMLWRPAAALDCGCAGEELSLSLRTTVQETCETFDCEDGFWVETWIRKDNYGVHLRVYGRDELRLFKEDR